MNTLSNHPRKRGFTLVELLVVIAIIVLLGVLTIPALSSIMISYNLGNTAQAISGQLNYARQSALTSNDAIQVRFYQIADAVNPSRMTYRAVQCYQETDNGTIPLTKPNIFPPGIVISSNIGVSTLLDQSTAGFGISPTTGGFATGPLLPLTQNANYLYFRYRPNGQTDLTPSVGANGTPVSPCITCYSETAPIVANNLPANYVVLQLDVINGTVRTFQP